MLVTYERRIPDDRVESILLRNLGSRRKKIGTVYTDISSAKSQNSQSICCSSSFKDVYLVSRNLTADLPG
jgi:hypothetical protein